MASQTVTIPRSLATPGATTEAPAPPPPSAVIQAPTPEMQRWARRLHSLLTPGSVAGTALVTPIAHVANGSLTFQTYLYAIFHRTWLARLGHALCMPLIVAAMLGVAFSLGPVAGVLATALVACWYIALAHRNGMPLLGTVAGALVVGLGALGALWAHEMTAWYTHPAVAVAVLGLAQAISHALEDVPPRVSGSSAWVPVREFFRRTPLRSLTRATLMIVPGALNEIWGSWRLLPILVLDGMWRAGYQTERRDEHAALVARACEGGNPAIDYIGTGGARYSPYR